MSNLSKQFEIAAQIKRYGNWSFGQYHLHIYDIWISSETKDVNF